MQKKLEDELVIAVYERSAFITDKAKKRAIDSFRNQAELNCFKAKRGRWTDLVHTVDAAQTCKMNAIDPLEWLSQTLSRIAKGLPVTEIEDLMPWNFKANAIG